MSGRSRLHRIGGALNIRHKTRYNDGGYDRLAASYESLEWLLLGRRLERMRSAASQDARLSNLDSGSRNDQPHALVFGGGTGRLIERLLRAETRLTLTSLERSTKMIAAQRRRVERCHADDRVDWIRADALAMERGQLPACDRVYFPFFLDCFSESTLRRKLPIWTSTLSPRGDLVWIDFVPNDRVLPRWRLWAMHRFFGLVTDLQNRSLVDIPSLLRDLSWQPIATEYSRDRALCCQRCRAA
ncbi:MAG: class I SAM-dependent methyltransferase [Planctomycetota bacterium]